MINKIYNNIRNKHTEINMIYSNKYKPLIHKYHKKIIILLKSNNMIYKNNIYINNKKINNNSL